jgi:hypothetical protein
LAVASATKKKLFLVKHNNEEEDLISFFLCVEQMAVNIPVICSLQSQKKEKKSFYL